jgi:hypothetical protein
MTIAAVFNFPGATTDQYEKVFKIGGAAINNQPSRLSHVCFATPDGVTVVDVWADEASFAKFGAVIGPATEQAGLVGGPSVYPAQGFMAADGIRNP